MAKTEKLARTDRSANQELQENQELMVRTESPDEMETQDYLEQEARRETKDHQARSAAREQRELLDQSDHLDLVVTEDLSDRAEPTVKLVLRVPRDHKDSQDHKELLEIRVQAALEARREIPDTWVSRASEV